MKRNSIGTETFVCSACEQEMSGYSKAELLLDFGWKWHDAKKSREFIMCGECEERFHERRRTLKEVATH